ncbi:MAG: hypothetical protein HY720_10115 [Planctomycetes bacterium]|nr:hypothetical protein [Planctomycetota bacterium]
MLPNVSADSFDVVTYAAEVAGRIQGVASVPNLVAEEGRRAELVASATTIVGATRSLHGAWAARVVEKMLEGRLAVGRGRGVDRGWDAAVAEIGERARVSLPDRQTGNPDYRAVFPDGTIYPFTTPTIKQDPELAAGLRKALFSSKIPVRTELVAVVDSMIPIIAPAAEAVRNGEEQLSNLFTTEMTARRLVVDTLWNERKSVEKTLGRGGRGLARFIFFDFRASGAAEPEGTNPPEAPGAPAPATP